MTEHTTELARPLVVGYKRDGRSCYDPEAKRQLIEACLRSGVSVARLAMQHGVNANLLRTWITRYRKQHETSGALAMALPAFVPVVTASPVPQMRSGPRATLANGVQLDLGGIDAAELPCILACLAALPCSASTRG
ncbi:MAG: transposase [Rhodocyclaceae bacterium]|jgi:transposase|nr:transposase [Rhodocyclaceae bacterium]